MSSMVQLEGFNIAFRMERERRERTAPEWVEVDSVEIMIRTVTYKLQLDPSFFLVCSGLLLFFKRNGYASMLVPSFL